MPDVPLCVYCRQRPVAGPWRPFCSERCRMADLGRWLTGNYRLPASPEDDVDAERDQPDEDADPPWPTR